MPNNKIWTIGLANALGTFAYIVIVAYVMSQGEKWFGKMDNVIAGAAILLLFVFSAAFVAGFILGRPVLLYMNDQKKEAVKLFHITLFWLAVLALATFGYLAAR